MAPRYPRRPRRISPALALFFVSALAFGAAAVLLAGPLAPLPTTTSGTPTPLSLTVVGYIALGLLVAVFGLFIVNSLGQGGRLHGGYASKWFMAIVLLIIAFVVLRFVSGGGSSSELVPPTLLPPTPPSSPGLNQTNGSFPIAQPFGLPGWVPFAAVVGVVAIVLVVVLPFLLLRARQREDEGVPVLPPQDVRADFKSALNALDRDENLDPRGTILALYAQLLRRVSGKMGDVSYRTPREIQYECVGHLGVRSATAGELTELFEEARYSTHSMGASQVEKARLALQHALEDLDEPEISRHE